MKHRGSQGIAGSVVVYDHHPFDVVGWDGQLYPYAFNYRGFAPVTGQLIQPPPTYQVFEGNGFVVCNFVPRVLELAVAAAPVEDPKYAWTWSGRDPGLMAAGGSTPR